MQKRSNSRQGLSSDARAWLDGHRNTGFFQFKPDAELQALWDNNGDADEMFWRRGMARPITLEDLKVSEDEWLNAGVDDEYGGKSFFIWKHYTDEEKQALWAERGDKSVYRWSQGMRKPEAIADVEKE
jgi:hypothetical protein